MNKKIFLIVSIGIIFAIAGFYLSPRDKQESSVDPSPHAVSDSTSTHYTPYTDSTFNDTSGKKVLFFYANWCPTCRPVDQEINSRLGDIPSDLTIFRVNYNDSDTDQVEKDLARSYNITYQHTFVLIDENGNSLKTWNGGGLDQILSMSSK